MQKKIKKNWLLIVSFFSLFLLFGIVSLIFGNMNNTNLLVFFVYSVLSFAINTYFSFNVKRHWDIPLIPFFTFIIFLMIFKWDFSNVMIILTFIFSYSSYVILSFLPGYSVSKKGLNIWLFSGSRGRVIINCLVPLIVLLALESYYSFCTFGLIYLPYHIQSFMVALLLICIVYFLFLFITGNTFRANITFSILLILIFVINQVRIFYTSDTLMFTDLMFLNTGGGEITQLMDSTFVNAIMTLLLPTLILILFIVWQCEVSKKYNIRVKGLRRIFVSFLMIMVILMLFVPNTKLDKMILDKFYNTSNPKDYAIGVSNTRYYKRFGVLSGMYGKYLEFGRYKPLGYDEEELQKTLDSAPKNKGSWGNPNVIVVFSESFWDVTRINGLTFDRDVLSNFHSLKNKGKLFQMITPSYGGISANVEYEILTGGSLDYFGKGYIPYMQLYNSRKSQSNPSIIREFNNNGYMTKILNASSASMFNCDKVYDYMGVKERRHIYNENRSSDGYVSDKYITDQIINEFSSKTKEEKLFYMAITMGGHMPYYPDKYSKYDISIEKSIYDVDTTETILSYAQGVYNADKELGRLYEYINTLEEETIIVFFGDHLPYIQNKNGEDCLEKVNYLNNNDDLIDIYKRFNTEALILSNYEIEFDDTTYISPDMLLTYVINNMDLSISSYYSWLYSTRNVFGSSNYVVSQMKDGKLYYTKGLEKGAKAVFKEREKIQYWLFN